MLSFSNAVEIFADLNEVVRRDFLAYDNAHRNIVQNVNLARAAGSQGRGSVHEIADLSALRLLQGAVSAGFMSADARAALAAYLIGHSKAPTTSGSGPGPTSRAWRMTDAAARGASDFTLSGRWYPGLADPLFTTQGLDIEQPTTLQSDAAFTTAEFGHQPPLATLTLPDGAILRSFIVQLPA